jgi:hypothetical protein
VNALDLPGGIVELHSEDVVQLRDAAAAQAGRSSAARDLALLLDRTLRRNRVALRRSVLQVLVATAEREKV